MSNIKQSQDHDTINFRENEPCIEEYRNFIQRSKNVGPEEMSSTSTKSFVDTLTEKEIDYLREKLLSYLENTGYESAKNVKTSKMARLQASDPTMQHEEAVISFEDAKSEVVSAAKSLVRQYDTEKWIEAELKDIRKSKVTSASTEDMQEAQLLSTENMNFTELEKKVAERTEMSDLRPKRQIKSLPVLKRTDILDMLLRIYESFRVETSERDEAYLAANEAGDLPTNQTCSVHELRKRLVVEMKAIYEQLTSITAEDILQTPEDNETENLSSSSSSLKIMSLAIPPMSPLELSTSAYPEPTTRSEAVSRDDGATTMSSVPFTTTDSPSGLINEPVIDMALAQAKSSTSSPKSSEDSISNMTTTSSTAISEESNTMSGISSLPTDPRTSVSSLRDADPRTSVSSLMDTDTRISGDTYPRTSVSSLMDTDQKTSMFSLRDIESFVGAVSPNILQPHLLSEDEASDDAFLAAPLAATANPSIMDSAEMAQNPRRRRSHSSKEDEDRNEAKRPAI